MRFYNFPALHLLPTTPLLPALPALPPPPLPAPPLQVEPSDSLLAVVCVDLAEEQLTSAAR